MRTITPIIFDVRTVSRPDKQGEREWSHHPVSDAVQALKSALTFIESNFFEQVTIIDHEKYALHFNVDPDGNVTTEIELHRSFTPAV
jgi:hypothetical protein